MSENLIASSVGRAREALAAVRQVPVFGLSEAEKLAQLDAARALSREAEAHFLRMVGEVDASELGREGQAARSTKQVLVQRLHITPGAAGRLVRAAEALRDPELEPTVEDLASGGIEVEQAEAIAKAMQNLPDETDVETRELVQELLIEHAHHFHAGLVEDFGHKALQIVDPELADEAEKVRLERREREAARKRTLKFQDTHDGSVRISGHLDEAAARIVRTALDPLTKPTAGEVDGSETGENGERRSYGQRMADALVELARRSLQAGTLPKHGGEPTQFTVTMRFDDLRNSLGAAFLPTGEAISATQARLLACDAGIIPAVLGSDGVPLDVGRMQRCFTGKLRKALDLRDGGCAFPGCDIPAAWCDAHHLVHWANGGPTALSNGVLLCRHHHSTIHKTEWDVRLGRDGRPEFLPPPWIDPLRAPRWNQVHHLPHAA